MKQNERTFVQPVVGWILLVAMVMFSLTLETGTRLILGLMLGYTLMRAYTGFAGSINRAYRGGSGKLMRAMAVMLFVTTVLFAFLLSNVPDIAAYKLWINPINAGLLLGGIFFGFGMSLSCCCASGVLTDISVGTPRALMTLLFFGIGVYLGFPVQHTAKWVTTTLFHSSSFSNGVFLPDLFVGDGFGGYLGAVVLTGLLCLVMAGFSVWYEKKKRVANEYVGIESEIRQEAVSDFNWADVKVVSRETYDYVFARPWTLMQGALVLSLIVFVMMIVTKGPWGASTPYGFWWGKIMIAFGASPESIAAFAKGSVKPYVMPFFKHGVSVQNFGIIVGTLIYLLQADRFRIEFTEGLDIDKRDLFIFALGGLTMGFGTRIANGCNVGAFYSPIACMSLSGWIYTIFLFAGAFIGNVFVKNWNAGKK